ncbi:DUF4198 domain-containing protein [Calycomorphotria hydatis]|uniref:Nickel uptake substrate-specific transmembrane region n=1 Tax=Calycomorphotria hydatis TaxID=2528027 RepID=A0A517TD90_9PLAN|nr:DUF4198 domain-containing protein [Calycomorphotria hydatis]QDT66340.1 hypothetical protein V22_36060 [Calycomorphotria hydatis]
MSDEFENGGNSSKYAVGAIAVALLCTVVAWQFLGSAQHSGYVPVEGTVTLDGKPLADANVVFEPIGTENGIASGQPSYAVTDSDGHFQIGNPVKNRDGAAVGEHRVRILLTPQKKYSDEQIQTARKTLEKAEMESGGTADAVTDEQVLQHLSDQPLTLQQAAKLPARYNTDTELTFTVLESGGTADFHLTSGKVAVD